MTHDHTLLLTVALIRWLAWFVILMGAGLFITWLYAQWRRKLGRFHLLIFVLFAFMAAAL